MNSSNYTDGDNDIENIIKTLINPINVTTAQNHNRSSADQETGISLILIPLICGITMTVLTFFGQIIVFIVTWNDVRLRRPHNYYIVSLALADFLISVISMPIWTIYSALGEYIFFT